MTKDNAKGITLSARDKLSELKRALSDPELTEAQIDDLACRIEFMPYALIYIKRAISLLSNAYRRT